MSEKLTTEQQETIVELKETFLFSPSNVKYSILAFLNPDSLTAADALAEKATQMALISKYTHGAVPVGVHGHIRDEYEKYGRSITLTDSATNYLRTLF